MSQRAWVGLGIVALLAGCGSNAPPPANPAFPAGPPADEAVAPEYTPGEVSQNPLIVVERPSIVASTLAGQAVAGGQDGQGTQASFTDPEGLEAAPDGSYWVAEPHAYRIRRISPTGEVRTVAGGGSEPGRTDGAGLLARFMGPTDMALSPQGDLYVADFDAVRRIDLQGTVSTLPLRWSDGSEYRPVELFGIARDRQGQLYLSHPTGIDRADAQGVVSRWAGGTTRGFADGTGDAARFHLPRKLAIDDQGTLYVADYGNMRLRSVDANRVVHTLAGSGLLGFTDGDASQGRFNFPMGLCRTPDGRVLVADTYNHAIRQLAPSGRLTTLAGANLAGYSDVGTILFDHPTDVAVGPDGTVAIADHDNQRVRTLR